MSKEALAPIFPEIDAFLAAAARDPNQPIEIVAEKNPRNALITGMYLDSYVSMERIGNLFDVTRERVHEIISHTIEEIRRSGSTEFQHRFPPNSVPTKKPNSSDRLMRRMQINNSSVLQIRDLVVMGKTLDEILAAGFTNYQITYARDRLVRYGIEIPKRYSPMRDAERVKVIEEADDEMLSFIVPQLPIKFVQRHTHQNKRLFVTLTDITRQYRYPKWEAERFVSALSDGRIPCRTYSHPGPNGKEFHYYHYPSRMLGKAKQMLEDAPNLARFKR